MWTSPWFWFLACRCFFLCYSVWTSPWFWFLVYRSFFLCYSVWTSPWFWPSPSGEHTMGSQCLTYSATYPCNMVPPWWSSHHFISTFIPTWLVFTNPPSQMMVSRKRFCGYTFSRHFYQRFQWKLKVCIPQCVCVCVSSRMRWPVKSNLLWNITYTIIVKCRGTRQ